MVDPLKFRKTYQAISKVWVKECLNATINGNLMGTLLDLAEGKDPRPRWRHYLDAGLKGSGRTRNICVHGQISDVAKVLAEN